MIYIIIAVVALAMMLGMILMSYVVGKKETPKAAVLAHGLFAVTTLILLTVYIFRDGPSPWESYLLFIMAAMGGIIMVYRDLTGKEVPHALAVAHGMIAMAGVVFLLVYAICDWSWLAGKF